ncbi:hypothetical protein G6F54_014578 [Rhizopus delemar]|nr:hypothetical protein G6F54_014578 [Rhizopus delemar]
MAVPNINENTTAEFYYSQVVSHYGVPNYILTDRGSNFTSIFTKTFLQWVKKLMQGIEKYRFYSWLSMDTA